MTEFRRRGAAALDDVLITHQLGTRARRPPDPVRENDAIHALVRDLTEKPQRVLQLLVDIALELCHAGSAGVSVREQTADGAQLVRWVAVAGQLAAYVGATAPADASPCGVCLERGAPQLFRRPARHFAYLDELPAPIEEALMIPFHVNGEVRGTIWVHAHDPATRFDAEHARLMAALAEFTGAAVHRLEVQAALRCSEDRLRSVVDLAPALVTAVDTAGRLVIFNRACEQLTGYAADDVIGADFVERLVPPAWQATVRRHLSAEGPLATEESRCLTRGGEERVVGWRWFRVPGLVVGVGEDLTERRRGEHVVPEQLLVARAITHHVAEAVFLTDATGIVTFANGGAERLLGRPVDEITGRVLHDVVHHGGTGARCVDGCALRADGPADGAGFHDDVFVRHDGSTVHVSCSRTPIERGDATGAIIVVRDDTLRKQAEQERVWYASQLAGLSGAGATIHSLSLHDALTVITDRAREIVGAHQAITMVTPSHGGASPLGTVSLSEKYAAWHGHELRPGRSPLDALVCRSNRPSRFTAAELDAHPARLDLDGDGGRPPLRGWLAAPLRDRDGTNLGLIQLSDKYEGDFTEQDEAVLVQLAQMASVAIHNAQRYEQGQAARATAEAANAAKDEFLAMLAHELRNPLGVILNSVSVLDRHDGRAPESIRVRELIRHHTRHLARLLDDLLDLARISQGRIQLRSEVLDVRAVVDIAVQAYRDGLEARGQTVSVSMPDAPVYVYGDRTRLQQIAGNLLDNASKYTPPGGSVWLAVEEINDEVLLSVRDNGIGIPPDKLESIFELFTQLDVSMARGEGGLGIGLTLVRRLTEMHGGRVHAHSDGRGSGSEFIVRLRRARAPLTAHTPAARAPRRSYDILIVEDNAAARDTLRFVLELEGHRVEVSADGLTGVEAGMRQRPDIAFVDIGLPGIDGYEVARRLRAVRGDGVRLFAVTGYAQPEDVRRARHAGFDGHLTKPVEVEEVLRILRSLERA
jgi:PAS domain S-box-containing protein